MIYSLHAIISVNPVGLCQRIFWLFMLIIVAVLVVFDCIFGVDTYHNEHNNYNTKIFCHCGIFTTKTKRIGLLVVIPYARVA